MKNGQIAFILGVSGSGKTTVSKALAAQLGGVYLDGDNFHPPENIARMRAGRPLSDAIRPAARIGDCCPTDGQEWQGRSCGLFWPETSATQHTSILCWALPDGVAKRPARGNIFPDGCPAGPLYADAFTGQSVGNARATTTG